MAKLTIDRFGFLRKDGKIIGWTVVDFIWTAKSWPSRVRQALTGNGRTGE